ncbi:rhamnogalacturonan endolyase [Marchantia polymorpha subsp. ruderalis]|uniref:rhamnogalacturonan endolyase n=2 Tax=Marchantia polymorpha TaxID=3197 RepID=A0AAF6BVM0_MARPO|nr:hypothetical protein MARPO_0074s0083 [Marchantia polymorpha]BBN16054.1 hypothetical protein Mp_7g03130 [Marchantia polymorpha subsp. ruderalis]|eukprot:PTQ35111.1 hypothetical protein MARPO_0074s0083 [Marchantia polymorpha]
MEICKTDAHYRQHYVANQGAKEKPFLSRECQNQRFSSLRSFRTLRLKSLTWRIILLATQKSDTSDYKSHGSKDMLGMGEENFMRIHQKSVIKSFPGVYMTNNYPVRCFILYNFLLDLSSSCGLRKGFSNIQAAKKFYTINAVQVVLDNGTVQVIITKPGGNVAGVKYGGMDNVLDASHKESDRGYWDMNWNVANGSDSYDLPSGTKFQLVHSDGDKVEVSFIRPYNSSQTPAMLPLDVDKRYVLLRGGSGFYTYAIYSRPAGWADFDLNQLRIVFKPRSDNFQYMAVADNKLRLMPSPDDLTNARSEELGYKEARLLTDPIESSLKGQVDDKYQYYKDNKDIKVHGWMSKDTNPTVGFWMITPSNEFKNGGPMKADLTCHTGPTCLSMFHSAHYAGIDLCPQFRNGEAWKKVFGPVYVYLNQRPAGTSVRHLWDDAKAQMAKEVAAWPYTWPSSSDYAQAEDRGQVSGRLFVQDSYAYSTRSSARDAWVGLSLPGDVGTWQTESKGYQFWTEADSQGNFSIKNVRAGTYSLNACVPSVIGDYLKDGHIKVAAGDNVSLGDLTYTPPRYGPTVWEIGNPSRTAADFYIPDADSRYPNLLYGTVEKWRNYGLWQRYTDLYPSHDLIFTVGTSDYTKDWFFAHLCRHASDGTWVAATWQIKFNLSTFDASQGAYKLRMAIAQAEIAAVQVRVNDSAMKPVYETPAFGKDNAIARHGIHGLYALYSIDIPAADLRKGDNIMYLTQRKASGPFNGRLGGTSREYDEQQLRLQTTTFCSWRGTSVEPVTPSIYRDHTCCSSTAFLLDLPRNHILREKFWRREPRNSPLPK